MTKESRSGGFALGNSVHESCWREWTVTVNEDFVCMLGDREGDGANDERDDIVLIGWAIYKLIQTYYAHKQATHE